MNDPNEFKRAYLSATSMEIVNYVRLSKIGIFSTDISEDFTISIQHASTLLTRLHTLGYLTRERTTAKSGGLEYLYRYDL